VTKVVKRSGDAVAVEVTVRLKGSFLDMEAAIQVASNAVGRCLTEEAQRKAERDRLYQQIGKLQMEADPDPSAEAMRENSQRQAFNLGTCKVRFRASSCRWSDWGRWPVMAGSGPGTARLFPGDRLQDTVERMASSPLAPLPRRYGIGIDRKAPLLSLRLVLGILVEQPVGQTLLVRILAIPPG
jgi:hypothetical protein